ncbi:MAG: glycosyltransferase family 4 protein [Thermoguttaceae bacterium]
MSGVAATVGATGARHDRPRLLYVTAMFPFGVGEPFFIPEVEELTRRGWDVRIVPRSPAGPVMHHDAQELADLSLCQPIVSWRILAAAVAELLRNPIAALRALGLLLHSNSLRVLRKNLAVYPKGLWLGRVARSWRADHIHAHWISTTATMAMVASIVSRIPWSCTAHRGDIADNNLLPVKASRAAFVRFISMSGRKMAESLGVRLPAPRAPVIHLGVRPPASLPAGERPDGPMVVFCLANLRPVKGLKYLIEAMAILKGRLVPCLLAIGGVGHLETELRAMVSRLSLEDRVQFLGFTSHDKVLGLYEAKKIDLVVLPSVDLGNDLHEGIPVSLMEAMAHGIPVVSTTTGGIPELLHDGAGILVPPQDATALANAIAQLVSNVNLRRTIGEAGRRRILEAFSVEHVVSELLAQIEGSSC